eukprot:Colp12_sorted_trinity150504_noHs@23485
MAGLRKAALVLVVALALSVDALSMRKVFEARRMKSLNFMTWNEDNDPAPFLGKKIERRFSELPLASMLDDLPWSCTYWPSYEGGIAYRWHHREVNSTEDGFSYSVYDRDVYVRMNRTELERLSPAEKFDLLRGAYDMPTVKSERKRVSPDDASWEGICHGWAPAAFLYKEPRAVDMVNPDNLVVPFGSGDVKALLSYYLAVAIDEIAEERHITALNTVFVGDRCNRDFESDPAAENATECLDTNAGAFHLVLTNMIAKHRMGFVADVTRDAEVWNQPVAGYKTFVLAERNYASPDAAHGTKKEIDVETLMYWGKELSASWLPTGCFLRTKNYLYTLELDSKGRIIGGRWSDNPIEDITEDRPDFLWYESAPKFYQPFDALEKLYNKATSASTA